MPMSFPDMKSLEYAAKVHKFRSINENETEDQYRKELAIHVKPRDVVESYEILFKVGWDEWTDEQRRQSLFESMS